MCSDGPIIITGAGGQLGCALVRALGGPSLLPWTEEEADVTHPDIAPRLTGARPRAIIHAAAWTNVDGCELDPDRAARVNAEATRRIAGAAAACGAHLVYLSTDYVFDGTKSTPYAEPDPPNPINVYGRTKLQGEVYVRALCPRHTILRTAWLYGPGGRTFVQAIIERARQEDRIEVVTDQVGSPTLTDDLAGVIRQVLKKELLGLFHAAGEGSCSRYDLAQAIVGAVRPGVVVIPVKTVPGARPARRPANAALATEALRRLGILLPPWHHSLATFLGSAKA